METLVLEYIYFLEWKKSSVEYIFSPRIDNALFNWIYSYMLRKEVWEYDYTNPTHKEISKKLWKDTEKVMKSMDSIISYLNSERLNPINFRWFGVNSYKEFLDKIKKYANLQNLS